MKNSLLFIFAMFFSFKTFAGNEKIRQIFLLRHAEYQSNGHLSERGKERAKALAYHLSKQKIGEIIVSSERRTQETAQILAEQENINPRKMTMSLDIVKFIKSRSEENTNIVVVSHSNILPLVVFELRAPSVYIPHDDYSNLYIITLEGNKFKAMTSLRY